MFTTEEMLARIAALENTLETIAIATSSIAKATKRATGKAATKAAKAKEKARKAQFKADRWHRNRLGATLSRYGVA
jgi:hypothetical protein